MKARAILASLFAISGMMAFGQRINFDLTFTAIDSAMSVKLDSVRVMNRTQGGATMIYWPDTAVSVEIIPGDTLLYVGYSTVNFVGVPETDLQKEMFQLLQNYPNPVTDQGIVSLYIPENGTVNLMVTDILGRVVFATDRQLDKGSHSFRFSPGDGSIFLVTAGWNGISRSIKVLATGSNSGKRCTLDYTGSVTGKPHLKASSGKELVMESGILDTPAANKTYTFQFASNIPCPGMPTVEFEGKVYNTVQIFSQCWLKENLNVGTMIDSLQLMTNNGILEKYCYHNNEDTCSKYGGFYQWKEAMQFTTQQGAQGICPPGWHIPADEEWKILEGAADGYYVMGDPEWDNSGYRGYNLATNLKTTSGWFGEINGTDLLGFSAMPAGLRDSSGPFFGHMYQSRWWTSSESGPNHAYCRGLRDSETKAYRYSDYKGYGYSVRCLRDNEDN